MDRVIRRSDARNVIGGLLAMPTFAVNLFIQQDCFIDTVTEEVLTKAFLSKAGDTLCIARNNDKSWRILSSLATLMEQGSFSPLNNGSDMEADSDLKNDLRGMKDQFIQTITADLSDIFQVEIVNAQHLRDIYSYGMSLLFKLNVAGGSCGTLSLLPVVTVASLACAISSISQIRVSYKEGSDSHLLGEWVDGIIRVWLHSLNAIGVNVERSSTGVHKEESYNCSCDPWVAYILAGRYIVQICKQYVGDTTNMDVVRTDTAISSDEVASLTFENVKYEDVVNVHAVMSSIQLECHAILRENYKPRTQSTSFEQKQAFDMAQDLSRIVRRKVSAGSKGEELERMRDLIHMFRSLCRRCTISHMEWSPQDRRSFELSFKSNLFSRADVYSLTCHQLVAISTVLLMNSSSFDRLYEGYVTGIVTRYLEDELKI